ncbi:MAG TPA: glycoside hydrolase family 5 protein [Polyangiaceae bacterium]|jgi:aryl-phospho-beta-D-glucosidase BglC (GH1 family)
MARTLNPTPVAVEHPQEFTHTAAELMSQAKIGWNLGNSLDVPEGETSWGNPRVTPDLLNAVAKAGFGLVRIPVTWAKHMGPAPAYAISATWFDRVDEVVGYARAAGLRVVINVHHDGADGFKGVQWLALKDASGNTTDENNKAVRARFITVWTQIAKHFSGFGEELMFESMNEIHDGYGNPDPRHFDIINDLNQQFVNLVRASGGNNTKRNLVIPGYNTNIDHTLKGFKLPTDSGPDHLILSVHFYDPYLFALQGKTHGWGKGAPDRDDWGQEDYVVKQFDRLKAAFSEKGVPVLIGEYGATHQSDTDDYQRYYMEYVTKAAVDRGMVPVFWDNGGSGVGGEKFGLFDRNSNTVLQPTVLEAMKRAATSTYSLSDIALPKTSK